MTTHSMTQLEANTVRDQIGNRAFVMMGTRAAGFTTSGFSFDVRASREFSHVIVNLNNRDTYDITFLKIRGVRETRREVVEDVDVSIMHQTLAERLQIALSL